MILLYPYFLKMFHSFFVIRPETKTRRFPVICGERQDTAHTHENIGPT